MSPELVNSSDLRVLVVDDNRDAAESLAMLVELWGHIVEVRYDATSAFARASSFQPHVVLLDIGLPRIDGYQLAQQIRQQGAKDAILIAVTGYADPDHRSQLESAFDHYLVKPTHAVQVERLLATVKNAINLPSLEGQETLAASSNTLPGGTRAGSGVAAATHQPALTLT